MFRFLYDGYFMSYSLQVYGNPFQHQTSSGDRIRVFLIRGKTVEAISFEVPQVFVPDPIHIHILQAVSDKQGCHIGHVVQQLLPTHGRVVSDPVSGSYSPSGFSTEENPQARLCSG
jgi:hypothetical protein